MLGMSPPVFRSGSRGLGSLGGPGGGSGASPAVQHIMTKGVSLGFGQTPNCYKQFTIKRACGAPTDSLAPISLGPRLLASLNTSCMVHADPPRGGVL